MNPPNKYTPKMLANAKGISLDYLLHEIQAGRVKSEVWYGEMLIDESVVRTFNHVKE